MYITYRVEISIMANGKIFISKIPHSDRYYGFSIEIHTFFCETVCITRIGTGKHCSAYTIIQC